MTDSSSARSHLTTSPAPASGHRATITLSLPFYGGTLTVEYVPHRAVLDRDGFKDYLKVIPGAGVEQLVSTMVDDLANELIPKWMRVTLTQTSPDLNYTVTMEDEQPDWAAEASRLSKRPVPS